MRHDHDLDDRCEQCSNWTDEWLDLAIRLTELKELAMTEADNQAHLNADVQALGGAFASVVEELKAQVAALVAAAAAAGTPAPSLDFTAADALVASTQAEATADAPAPRPSPGPSLTPDPTPVAGPAPADPNAAPVDPASVNTPSVPLA